MVWKNGKWQSVIRRKSQVNTLEQELSVLEIRTPRERGSLSYYKWNTLHCCMWDGKEFDIVVENTVWFFFRNYCLLIMENNSLIQWYKVLNVRLYITKLPNICHKRASQRLSCWPQQMMNMKAMGFSRFERLWCPCFKRIIV